MTTEREWGAAISEDEMTQIALAMGRQRPFTEDEYVKVIEWANTVSVDAMFLNLILNGKVNVTWADKDGITLHKL